MQAPIFITLNIVDSYLTKMALQMGATEANPFMATIGSMWIAKGLLAIAFVLILYYFRKEKVLWLLNFLMIGVILWNSAIYWILTLSQQQPIIPGL